MTINSEGTSNRQRNIATAYFKALQAGGITAKTISKKTKIREATISSLKNGGTIQTEKLQKMIDALPEEIYNQYLRILLGNDRKKSTIELANQIEDLAFKLRQYRYDNSPRKFTTFNNNINRVKEELNQKKITFYFDKIKKVSTEALEEILLVIAYRIRHNQN